MLDIVVQAPILQRFQKFFQAPPQVTTLNAIVADLRGSKNLVNLGKQHGFILTPLEERHVRHDWLNESGTGWWKHAQPIEPILRAGLVKAFEMARDLKLPVAAYWICASSRKGGPFALKIGASQWQVTVSILSPPPEGPPPSRLVEDRSLWVSHRDAKNAVVTRPIRSMPPD